jgi:branched-chain amino acid transport system permease protein
MKRDYKVLILFIIALAIFPPIASHIEGIQHYIDIMVFVGIFSLITIGLSLLMGYAGQISLGHAAFFGIGAYTSAVMTGKFGFNPWVAFLAGILLTVGIAYLIGLPSLKLRGHYLAMATLGFGIIVFIVFNEWDAMTSGPSGFSDIPGISIAGYDLDTDIEYYGFVWAIVVLVSLFSLNVIHSRIGRAYRSIHGSEDAANAMGVHTSKYKIQIFVLSALYASIAGSLYTHYMNFLNPSSFNLFFSIKLVIMVILGGGMANIWGAVLGTWTITLLGAEWLHFLEEFEFLAYGAILLSMTIFLPRGLIGLVELIGARWRRGLLVR